MISYFINTPFHFLLFSKFGSLTHHTPFHFKKKYFLCLVDGGEQRWKIFLVIKERQRVGPGY
jgi:hypothetical protein